MSGLVHCPYNHSHVMPADRLQWHLTMVCKDMRQQSHLYSVCPYNRTHHVRTPKLDDHVKKCPDRPSEGKREEMEAIARSLGPPDEAWESSWPEERKNLNVEYVPAVARNRGPQPNLPDSSNLNQPPPQPAAPNPYLVSQAPAQPSVQSDADADAWETIEPKRRQKQQPVFNSNLAEEETLAQIQAKALGKSSGKRGGRR